MDRVQRSVAPLSPFTWDTEDGTQSTDTANAVLRDISLLDLRFDLVLDEFAIPCHHTLHRINGGHPLERKNLSLRQLQLLQYGVVVHGGSRLVLVAVPPCCGDSGACLAASYEHLFSRSLDTASTVAHHPLLPEYIFIVYRLPETTDSENASERPEALFRLVYRNVNPHSSTRAASDFDVGAAPEYKLVAVLVASSSYYGELQRVSRYRREWYANTAATRASGVADVPFSTLEALSTDLSASQTLPEPVAAEVRRTSSLSALCTCFARVLARFTAVEEEGKGTLAAAAGPADDDYDNSTDAAVRLPLVVPGDAWCYQYTRDGERLLQRIDVVERTKAVLQSWRDGELDLTQSVVQRAYPVGMKSTMMGDHCTHPPLSIESRRTPCGRLLLIASHNEFTTQVVDNEIVSFLPFDTPPSQQTAAAAEAKAQSDVSGAVVYASPAAERLRRWILQGLVAAEVHDIHAVLLDLDPVSVLQPCVELLAVTNAAGEVEEDSEEEEAAAGSADVSRLRYRRALLLVCQVVMETVERFVRHSGLVWKVTVAVREAGADSAVPVGGATSFAEWCVGMLELTREAEVQRETSALRNRLSFAEDGEEKTSAASGGMLVPVSAESGALVCGQEAQQDERSAALAMARRVQEAVNGAVALYKRDSAGPAAPLHLNVVTKAKEVGVKVDEAQLRALFETFCAAAKRRDMLLPASALVELLTEEWSPDTGKRRRYPAAARTRLVCPLDSCGVPVTRASVQRFLRPFLNVMRDAAPARGVGAAGFADTTPAQALNYAQFSMVMFAIAKM